MFNCRRERGDYAAGTRLVELQEINEEEDAGDCWWRDDVVLAMIQRLEVDWVEVLVVRRGKLAAREARDGAL